MKKRIIPFLLWALFLILLIPQGAEAALCKVGDTAQVLWGGKWWSATVLEVNSTGTKCKIRYKGYSSKWDEWVGADRYRSSSSSSATSSSSKNSGSYSVGQGVKVLWGGKWWSAKILQKKGDSYYIQYDGYGSKWNEWVTPSRMKPK